MKSKHHSIASIIQMQAKQHGYHLTDAEAKDIAAQVVMYVDDAGDDDLPRHEVDEAQMWRPGDEVRP